jgi:hypothetical protein
MNLILEILSIGSMILMTYVIFISFGERRPTLLFTKEEKENWDSVMSKKIGSWFTRTNIIGTLTSLATVYIFFIGSSKLFGFFIFICSLTIWLGAYITNFTTKKICAIPYVSNMLNSPSQTGGVIACLFWRPKDKKAQYSARLTKWISIVSIFAVIWFEFSLFGDIAGGLASLNTGYSAILIFFCALSVFYFTLKYGLRGFVFADFFQAPLIIISSIVLFIGVFILGSKSNLNLDFTTIFKPLLSLKDCILFVVQVLSLNLFLVLATEPHWLRVWMFRDKETTLQGSSTLWAAILWGILAIIGLYAFQITSIPSGPNAIIVLLQKLSSLSNLFLVIFWIGGMAALFSTADGQIYSLLVVSKFDSHTGLLNETRLKIRPLLMSFVGACIFAILFSVVKYFNLPFEKMIFIAIPICLNIIPAFVLSILNLHQNPIYIIISIFLYSICSTLGFFQPASEFSWTLLAPFCPIAVSIIIYLLSVLKLIK